MLMHDPRAADEMANSADPDQTAAFLFYRTAMIFTQRNIKNNAGKMENIVNFE